MNYETYLKNKGLTSKTIHIYLRYVNLFLKNNQNNQLTKSSLVKTIRVHQKNHEANSTRIYYYSIISYLKFLKKWKLINELRDIKLPTSSKKNRVIISLEEFESVFKTIKMNSLRKMRDWLIFYFLFCTGIRVGELYKIDLRKINNSKLEIVGKGNKTRIIYIPDNLNSFLKLWKYQYLPINKNKKFITYKTINLIVKKIGNEYFNKDITPHSLRRSYATNLLRKQIDIKTISELMGHSNINTTSSYIFLSHDEIKQKLSNIFDFAFS